MRRTLASRGFVLPKTPPKVGHARFDAASEWNALALRKVVAEFLAPEKAPFIMTGRQRDHAVKDIIDHAAVADGFPRNMHMAMGCMRIRPVQNSVVNEWLGIPIEDIWPVHKMLPQDMPPQTSVTTQSDGKAEENPILMGGDHIAPHVFCLPFVHAAPKRVNVRLAVAAAAIAAGLARFLLGGRQ